MRLETHPRSQHLQALPMPLASVGIQQELNVNELADLCPELLAAASAAGRRRQGCGRAQVSRVQLGPLAVHLGRTCPVDLLLAEGEPWLLLIGYAGQAVVRAGDQTLALAPAQAIMVPRGGCTLALGHRAGIGFRLDRRRLESTLLGMGGSDHSLPESQPRLIAGAQGPDPSMAVLLSLFAHIGEVIQASSYLADGLGLDDQLYRTLALCLLDRERPPQPFTSHRKGSRLWNSTLDELVDYIRTHLHETITLADLEQRINYSDRHLQSLFRDRFACTPMQYVRRQRLGAAMDRLQEGRVGDTVTRIARDCGYGYVSNFSSDFQRSFAISPSLVLRRALRERGVNGEREIREGGNVG